MKYLVCFFVLMTASSAHATKACKTDADCAGRLDHYCDSSGQCSFLKGRRNVPVGSLKKAPLLNEGKAAIAPPANVGQ